MKVIKEHQELLRAAIEPLDTPEIRESYRTGWFTNSSNVKDLDKRYRWDLLWASGAYSGLWASEYLDAHIDTALKSIVPPIEGETYLEQREDA